jgi:hypothetical protein
MTTADIRPLRFDPTALAADKRRSLTRAITAAVLTSGDQQGVRAPTTFLRANWGDDTRAALYLKAAVSHRRATRAFRPTKCCRCSPRQPPAGGC